MPVAISVFFDPAGKESAQDAAVLDMIDKLGRSAALASTLNGESGLMSEPSSAKGLRTLTKVVAAVQLGGSSSTLQTVEMPASQAPLDGERPTPV